MTIKELRRIGSRLREARKEQHLTQEQLAEMVDKSAAYIGMIERGKRMPSLITFLDIVEVLETTADAILCDAVSYGYKVCLGKHAEQVEKLSKRDRDKLVKIIADFLE